MSGLIGVHELMYVLEAWKLEVQSCTMECTAPCIDGDGGDAENLCEGYIEGYVNGPVATNWRHGCLCR